jgi:MFS family permease
LRRLGPLVLSQACGAFNDNLVKNAMLVFALFTLGVGGAELSALAGALFIAPYILLSATAGKLADRLSKPRLVVVYKWAELGLMGAAGAAFWAETVTGLLLVLFGLGVQATLFGPVKYGILPELTPQEELLAGNGLIEASTFVAIVLGTVLGGALVLLPGGTLIVAVGGVGVAGIGLLSAWALPPRPPAAPSLWLDPNPLRETATILRVARAKPAVWLCVLALSWFWTLGATLLTEFPVLARDTLGASGGVLTALLTVFALGVGTGSLLCARLSHGEVSARLVPFAALGLSVFIADFAWAAATAEGLTSVEAVLGGPAGWRMLANLFLLAACGGVFSVPLYAILLRQSGGDERARMIGANNVMNALFMVLGAGAAAGLAALGLDAPAVLGLTAAVNLLVAVWIWRVVARPVSDPR